MTSTVSMQIADRRRAGRRKADRKFLLIIVAGFLVAYAIGFLQGLFFSGA